MLTFENILQHIEKTRFFDSDTRNILIYRVKNAHTQEEQAHILQLFTHIEDILTKTLIHLKNTTACSFVDIKTHINRAIQNNIRILEVQEYVQQNIEIQSLFDNLD